MPADNLCKHYNLDRDIVSEKLGKCLSDIDTVWLSSQSDCLHCLSIFRKNAPYFANLIHYYLKKYILFQNSRPFCHINQKRRPHRQIRRKMPAFPRTSTFVYSVVRNRQK